MELLQSHRLRDRNRERRVSVDVVAEEHSLCPGLGGEVDLAPLHCDLPRCGLAGSASLRPNHLDREEVAGEGECLLGDAGYGEGLKGDFNGAFHSY